MEENRYYPGVVAAFIRGCSREENIRTMDELIALGRKMGLGLYKFKCHNGLPRVQQALGILRGFYPAGLLDVGSGRGTFLWPLIEAFPELPVVAIDRQITRIVDIAAVRAGGFSRLIPAVADALHLPFAADSFDGVTALEVLEHLARPDLAAAELLRVARRFILASAPSKEDNNPEHLHLFSRELLDQLFRAAGARRVSISYVLNHMIAVVKV